MFSVVSPGASLSKAICAPSVVSAHIKNAWVALGAVEKQVTACTHHCTEALNQTVSTQLRFMVACA